MTSPPSAIRRAQYVKLSSGSYGPHRPRTHDGDTLEARRAGPFTRRLQRAVVGGRVLRRDGWVVVQRRVLRPSPAPGRTPRPTRPARSARRGRRARRRAGGRGGGRTRRCRSRRPTDRRPPATCTSPSHSPRRRSTRPASRPGLVRPRWNTVTSWPSATARSTACRPTNEVPPMNRSRTSSDPASACWNLPCPDGRRDSIWAGSVSDLYDSRPEPRLGAQPAIDRPIARPLRKIVTGPLSLTTAIVVDGWS